MFGESDSESPRVPSPWDSLASTPSLLVTPPKHNVIPKLIPEVEEGNVEYKLQLLPPTPIRFAHLVTQLKWRLLEGGGQAYYELGVADSGNLVGLPREQLEESLETLDMMAGEIGASVIVVKEIEVPPEISSLAESRLERWDGHRGSTRRKGLLRMMKQDMSPTAFAPEFQSELSSTDLMDAEESTCHSPITPPASPGDPTPLPFDPALVIFTMDIGEDTANYADNEAPDDDVQTDCVADFSVSLKISSVYKPRQMKKRTTQVSPPSTHFEYMQKRRKSDRPPSKSTGATCHTGHSMAQDSLVLSQPKEAKAQIRGDEQDKWRNVKYNAHVPAPRPSNSPNSADHQIALLCSADESNPSVLESFHINKIDPPAGDASGTTTITSKEPRFIVEVLVVRELSLDEAFLDFEGFSVR